MKNPQIINLNEDAVIAFDGDIVINDTDQETLGVDKGESIVPVTISLYDLTAGSDVTPVSYDMTYHAAPDFWTIPLSAISAQLTDRHKYVGKVEEYGAVYNLRTFKIQEFSVDNDSFEDVLMRLPYQVVVSGGEAWIKWYEDETWAVELFEAPAYEGGTGTTYATDPARVTHRGAITKV